MLNLIYPGNSSYHIETGGKLKNLRLITIQDVREYHEKYYRPENLYLTITGQLDPKELFEVLDKIETKIVKKRLPPPNGSGLPPSLERPFIRDSEPLNYPEKRIVQFPSEDEQFGWVKMGWRVIGNLNDNLDKMTDLAILNNYLTSTSVSPLTKTFVDIPEPLATSIDYDTYMNWEPCIVADFYNVPVQQVDKIEQKYNEVIQNIINTRDIDMDRIHTIGIEY